LIERPIWEERLAAAWKQASIVWLTGPRRVGKTVLAQSGRAGRLARRNRWPHCHYVENSELRSIAEMNYDGIADMRTI